jgi:hypothetical protein
MSLYEFKIQRTYENGTVKVTDYQLPAENEMDALVSLGRAFPEKDTNDFKLKVLSFNLVGVAKAVLARRAMVEKILHHQFSEPDYDSKNGGECVTLYEVKDTFSSEMEARYLINVVLDAHEVISRK